MHYFKYKKPELVQTTDSSVGNIYLTLISWVDLTFSVDVVFRCFSYAENSPSYDFTVKFQSIASSKSRLSMRGISVVKQ